MNRQIKVRVWDKAKRVFIPNDVYAIISSTEFNAFNPFGIMLKDWENYKKGQYLFDNYQVLMEFTGLKDSKRTAEFPDGQPIYEGDIIRSFGSSVEIKHIVSYNEE